MKRLRGGWIRRREPDHRAYGCFLLEQAREPGWITGSRMAGLLTERLLFATVDTGVKGHFGKVGVSICGPQEAF